MALAVLHSADTLQARAPRPLVRTLRSSTPHCCSETPPEEPSDLGDWRDLRARLVAAEQKEKAAGSASEGDSIAAPGGFVFESPLIEQGSVILGGTKQEFGFALRQQYFHKCVMLLLQVWADGVLEHRVIPHSPWQCIRGYTHLTRLARVFTA